MSVVRNEAVSQFIARAKDGFAVINDREKCEEISEQDFEFIAAASSSELLAAVILCRATDRASAIAGVDAITNDLRRNINMVFDAEDKENADS